MQARGRNCPELLLFKIYGQVDKDKACIRKNLKLGGGQAYDRQNVQLPLALE
jgi:hypothetical protein